MGFAEAHDKLHAKMEEMCEDMNDAMDVNINAWEIKPKWHLHMELSSNSDTEEDLAETHGKH